MKIQSRLLLYNIIIIVLSVFLVIFTFSYVSNSDETFYNIESIAIDENVTEVKQILNSTLNYDEMAKQLNNFHYKLYVYDNNTLIYGKENMSVNNLLNNYRGKRNMTKVLFLDNSTAVIKVKNNNISIALKDSPNVLFFNNTYNPYKAFLLKTIFLIVLSSVFILLLATLLSNLILRNVMAPVKKLTEGAKRIKNGNYKEPVIYNNNDEFSVVVDNFNEMQRALKEKNDKAQRYENAKREMINGISHDIRTPLTVVKGNIKGITDGVASTKEKRNEYLNIAYSRVIDIENLLNELFDTFNYETGQIKLNKEKVNLKEFVLDIVNVNQNIKINTKIDKNIIVNIDKVQFKRVFDNLINNSIKYADKKKLVIDIEAWTTKSNIKIMFKDNGKGVKEETIPYLFDEFFKEDKSRGNNGSGLGLFIVKSILDAHEGIITVQNKRGLCFEIILKDEINE